MSETRSDEDVVYPAIEKHVPNGKEVDQLPTRPSVPASGWSTACGTSSPDAMRDSETVHRAALP